MGRTPKKYPFLGYAITVKRLAQMLNLPIQTAYWHFWRAGRNMERAYAEADRARTERAARKILKIITKGGGA